MSHIQWHNGSAMIAYILFVLFAVSKGLCMNGYYAELYSDAQHSSCMDAKIAVNDTKVEPLLLDGLGLEHARLLLSWEKGYLVLGENKALILDA